MSLRGGHAPGLTHRPAVGLPPVLLDPATVTLGDEPLPAPGGHLAHQLVGEEAGTAAATDEPLEDALTKVSHD